MATRLLTFELSTVSFINTDTNVIYNISRCEWKRLPNKGFILLQINQTSAETTLPVAISTNCTNLDLNPATPLINGVGAEVLASEIVSGNRYLIYYNKCNGIFQLVNYIPAATT